VKILQLAKFYPPELGGMESAVRELTDGLNSAGWSTDVLCAHRSWRTTRERGTGGHQVVRAGSLGMLLSTSMSPALVRETMRQAPAYDIVHVHMPNPMSALALRIARPAAKLVVHWHSDVIRQRLALRSYEPLQRWLLRRADRVITTSLAYANASAALAPWLAKVEVVPLGIGDNANRSQRDRVVALRALYPGKRIVFALGRMAYYKGFDVLVEAAAVLPEDTIVLIGGAGELLDRHRARAAALGLGGRVSFVGPIADDDLMTYHAAADVFCMPSIERAEAFGVAMLEAMAAGRPVVASDIPGSGVPWINAEGVSGYNVTPGHAPALAAALRHVLADPALARRLGEGARQRYLQHFTAKAMTARVIDLYRRLLAA
jgi:glycosyltransferase involved in cell wall biosynthesis